MLMKEIVSDFKCFIRRLSSRRTGTHPDGDIMIFSTARSGSTWVKEVIASQQNIKFVSEPLLMESLTRRQLGVDPSWGLTIPSRGREQILKNYFQRQFSGSCGYGSPSFKSEFYRKRYDRVVLKLLRCQDMMNWCADQFGVKVVYLLRHPVPVALSRKEYKRLPMFLESDEFRERYLSDAQHAFALDVVSDGTALEHKILDWCLQNLAPLKHLDSSRWLTLYYEDIVMTPEQQLEQLSAYLNLEDVDSALARINQASSTTYKSDAETQAVLSGEEDLGKRRSFLVNKWLSRVNETEQAQVQAIFDQFEIDVYRTDAAMPVVRMNSEAIACGH